MNPSRFFLRSWLTIGISLFLVADLVAQTRATQTPTRSTTTPTRSTATGGGGGGGSGGGGGAANRQYNNATMVGDAMITSDMESRRLIIVTDDDTNENIKTIIASLDKPKPQVLINVVFLQVTHGDDLDLGAEATYAGKIAIKGGPLGTATTKFGLGSALDDATHYGSFYNISGQHGLEATLHALAVKSKTEILSRPSILTRSSQQATILVGQQIPIITNSRVSDTNNTTINTVTYQDVGIILRVTPFITQAGLVEMIVSPEISSLSATTVAISNTVNSPVIDKRSADTVVVTPSDQTVVIGGLISTQVIDQENKVPLLGDIPILGYAFKRNIKKNQKTELLIFLTPHVVADPKELAGMAKDEQSKLELAPKTFEKQDMKKYLGNP
jgi:general secretion pathway protein D